ncbi:MAG: DnaJ domain-containing protein [Alphaproteobacteria bacterium]|nr:DnaJ domain-containing protein [Alphaproteobacteria bacterium]
MEFDALGYYEVLGVTPTEDIAVIKRQYYERAKYWHPDHNNLPNAQDMFQKVSVAYSVLQDSHSRLIYTLLSGVYGAKKFPVMGSLKIYKNQAEKDDKALRVLKQHHSTAKGVSETKDICNIREAGNMVLATSLANWLKGWWHKNGYRQTMAAIKYNMRSVAVNDADNLQLLVHNAVAYEQENNKEMAWIYAKQADLMLKGDTYLKYLLSAFIEQLDFHPAKTVKLPYWNARELKLRQFLFPFIVVLGVILLIIMLLAQNGFFTGNTKEQKNYYEERRFGDTLRPSDMIENRILKNDSSIRSTEDLAHFKEDCTVYHGPDTRYSPMVEAKKDQTVRITGYTYDKEWYQIILDNGEIGFVHKSKLEKGMGSPVPVGSHVYKG